MKKFFELSINSKKNVKGDVVAKLNVYSEEQVVGRLDIKTNSSEEGKWAAFVKYTPMAADSEESITKIKFDYDKENKLQDFLEMWTKASIDTARSQMKMEYVMFFTLFQASLKDGEISLPTDLFNLIGIKISSKTIAKTLGDEWIGIETFVSDEIKNLTKPKEIEISTDKDILELLKMMH